MKPVRVLSITLVLALVACGQKEAATEKPAPAASAASVAAPVVATVPTAAPAPASTFSAADLALGEKVYTATCLSCHGAGVLGAPKFGDATAWQPRLAKGRDALHGSALNGFKMMPARGGNAALKDDEIKAAVDYMLSKAA